MFITMHLKQTLSTVISYYKVHALKWS